MSTHSSPSWRKTVIFVGMLTTMLVGATAMSLYKIAIANSYVTQALPLNPNAPPRPETRRAEWGAHLAQIIGCTDCHGSDYGGRALIDRPGYATVIAPNLTRGVGGRSRTLSDDLMRQALQAGLDGEERVLWGMPRHSLNALAQDDVWALMDHLAALPPVDREFKQNRLDFWGYIDVALRRLNLVDRTHLPILPPKIAPSSLSLDNAARAFGSDPKVYAAWPVRAPLPAEPEYPGYVRNLAHCGACHGNTFTVVGRVQAQPLRKDKQDVSRCRVSTRLLHLTSDERAAMFEF